MQKKPRRTLLETIWVSGWYRIWIMTKERKKRRSRTKDGYITFIVDDDDVVKYLKDGRSHRRRYAVIMHRNNFMGKYCAMFGYHFKDGSVKKLWIKTANQFGFASLKDELMHRYHNHLEILLEQIRLVKVKKSILDEGGVPGLPSGKGLPVRSGYNTFKIIKKKKRRDFDLLIEGIDGRKFRVSSDCMIRTWPVNWIEDKYSE